MALSKDRMTPAREGALFRVKVKGATRIHAGGLIAADAGYAKPAAREAGLVALGRAEEAVDNSSGSDGDAYVLVRRGVFLWGNSAGGGAVGQAEVGKNVYMADDESVDKRSASSSVAGKCLEVGSEGVWVETQ